MAKQKVMYPTETYHIFVSTRDTFVKRVIMVNMNENKKKHWLMCNLDV
jgi:hypothetical protein